ncbi:hypothetical protein ACWCPH_31210, partial [Streptomyces zhihengii]
TTPAADGPGTDTAPDAGTGPGDGTASAAAPGPDAAPATTGDGTASAAAPGPDAAPATATTEQDTTEEGAADALAETGRA